MSQIQIVTWDEEYLYLWKPTDQGIWGQDSEPFHKVDLHRPTRTTRLKTNESRERLVEALSELLEKGDKAKQHLIRLIDGVNVLKKIVLKLENKDDEPLLMIITQMLIELFEKPTCKLFFF